MTTISPDSILETYLTEELFIGGPGCSSTNRADLILFFANKGFSFSKLVKMNWSTCDNFHELTEKFREKFLLEYDCVRMGLRTHHQVFERFLSKDCKTWWNGVPDRFNVYRGCEESRWHGLSWTLDKAIAEGFSSGHRGLKLKSPVVASANISKEDVFFATNDREEKEIVWDATAENVKINFERVSVCGGPHF